jgi:dTDP-4-dehydrorhamnose reductase
MAPRIEIWAGIECTVNRVGDAFHNQMRMSGHDSRASDLYRFRQLGIKTLRFPVLWELHAPNDPRIIDWGWADQRLNLARELGLQPIVGFLHHGSGPIYTNLLDPEFSEKLEVFAEAFARRFPWVTRYTPINEPLTTARFSGLYGHWYPHLRNEAAFLRMLVNECRAVGRSMQVIRSLVPAAELILTEDMGKTFSTPYLSYQADYENERRWLSLDIMTHHFGPKHPFWESFIRAGVSESLLSEVANLDYQPAIIGINHYITSNRFLDERLERYPKVTHGGNGRHRYADVEAVRVGAEIVNGPADVVREAWERYHCPVALTEVHMGCTRDEQMRWFFEALEGAQQLRDENADVRAITAWSLLGAFDWNSLVTQANGDYEPGVFDLRGSDPRPTALAEMIRQLLATGTYNHPVLDSPGWWRRTDRLLYSPVSLSQPELRLASSKRQAIQRRGRDRKLLIIGRHGTLATAFQYVCLRRGLEFRSVSRQELDAASELVVRQVIGEMRPWAVINAAGFCAVDAAESQRDDCWRDNVVVAESLASVCSKFEIKFATFSSDLVFDGSQNEPYIETHSTAPLNFYGQSKAAAERQVVSAYPGSLVVRTSAFFGPWDEHSFLVQTLRRLNRGHEIPVAHDQVVSPTYVPDLVNAVLDLLIDGETGIWHATNPGALSWADIAVRGADVFGIKTGRVLPVSTNTLKLAAERPPFSALASGKAQILKPFENALERFRQECRVAIS